MTITIAMVITYILLCIRVGTKPCKYFQLNSKQFDGREGIFSKLAIDDSIPAEWRLEQQYDTPGYIPTRWPVFLKPEWGQNAAGVRRADNIDQLDARRSENAERSIRYLVQEAAPEKRHHKDKSRYAILTVTEAVNDSEENPVNSIYNPDTGYVEITDQFSSAQLDWLWQLINRMGNFNISRASLRANSVEDLLAGRFHVIEINLFLPMPINMLDKRYGPRKIAGMVLQYMMSLARLTRERDKSLKEKPVFTKIMLYNRTSPLLNYLRARI